jgi:hypothetical protein
MNSKNKRFEGLKSSRGLKGSRGWQARTVIINYRIIEYELQGGVFLASWFTGNTPHFQALLISYLRLHTSLPKKTHSPE